MTDAIKSMKLYPRADRILTDLRARGYDDAAPVPVAELSTLDQLHYYGTDAVDHAISSAGMKPGQTVLEVGSGWGGCARWMAHRAGVKVTAVELQQDYHGIAQQLSTRAALGDSVQHVNADFLTVDLPDAGFDHAASWLALFHIPNREKYLGRVAKALKPGGTFVAEDLFAISPPPEDEKEDFAAMLFPNSLVDWESYGAGLEAAGFEVVELEDMTTDWAAFTAHRNTAFQAGRSQYEAVHGTEGYATIAQFYDKMAGYLARRLVGGVRFVARKKH